MDYQLEGKLCLVSGSTAGIGLANRHGAGGEGAEVIVNGRTDDRVAEAIDQIRKKHPQAKLKAFAGDLSRPDQVNEVDARFQRLDVLVNNLGVYEPKPFEKLTDARLALGHRDQFFQRAAAEPDFPARHAQPQLGPDHLHLERIGRQHPAEMIQYGVTKSMQIALARGLAETTKGTGVTVNSVLPGPTRSEGVNEFVKDMAKQGGRSAAEVEKDFFTNLRPSSLLQPLRHRRGGGEPGRLRGRRLSSATNGAALRVDGGVIRSIL